MDLTSFRSLLIFAIYAFNFTMTLSELIILSKILYISETFWKNSFRKVSLIFIISLMFFLDACTYDYTLDLGANSEVKFFLKNSDFARLQRNGWKNSWNISLFFFSQAIESSILCSFYVELRSYTLFERPIILVGQQFILSRLIDRRKRISSHKPTF